MKVKLKIIIMLLVLSIPSTCMADGKKKAHVGAMTKIGEIAIGAYFPNKIQVLRIQDPDMPFITIYLTTVKAGSPMAIADPSDNSIATRLTGPITEIVKKTNPEIVNLNKSIGWKTIKIARFWDEANQTAVYVPYSTKVIDGSNKHSLSVVPLGKHR